MESGNGILDSKINFVFFFLCRCSYTSQVHSAFDKIQRQKDNNAKVSADIIRSRKDVNALEGVLHRTYAELDALLFKVRQPNFSAFALFVREEVALSIQIAEEDRSMVPAYRCSLELYEDSCGVLRAVEDAGKTKRKLMEVQQLVDQERARQQKKTKTAT